MRDPKVRQMGEQVEIVVLEEYQERGQQVIVVSMSGQLLRVINDSEHVLHVGQQVKLTVKSVQPLVLSIGRRTASGHFERMV